jgi:hypothetical protein
MPVTAFTDPISWFADVDYAMMDANGSVDPVGWQFQGRDGKWMCEDDDLELKRSPLDYGGVSTQCIETNPYPYQQESKKEQRERD